MEETCAIVLAGGLGTRMKSDKPKVLHELAGKPMLFYTLEKLNNAGIPKIIVVIGPMGQDIVDAVDEGISFKDKIEYKEQPQPKGTGDALKWGVKDIDDVETVLVVNGDDSAFYNPDTVREVVDKHKKETSVVTFISLEKEDPEGFGRIVRDDGGKVVDIVEEKDANLDQKAINEVNAGFYVFNYPWLKENIEKIKLSRVGEYYIVDLVKIAVDEGEKVTVHQLEDESQWYGVNTKAQLMSADRVMREKLNNLIE